MKKRRRLKIKPVIITILLIISLTSFVYSLIHFINWGEDNKEVKEIMTTVDTDNIIVESTEGEEVNSKNESKESIYWSYIKMNLISVDFDSLLKTNKDTVGWISVNGTNINYPIVQTKDNKYYLTHSFEKTYTDAGWVFMDYRNNAVDFDKNTIIYAHARKDKSMFGSLKNILKGSWYGNSDNHIIKLSTPSENTLWQVFSIYHIPTESYYITTSFKTDKEYETFLNTIKKRSAAKFDATLDVNDKILTLSTCYNDSQKVVLHAKLIKREQR